MIIGIDPQFSERTKDALPKPSLSLPSSIVKILRVGQFTSDPLTFVKPTAKLGGSMTKRTHLVFNFFGAVLLFAIATVVALAQTSGEISGLVTDPSGAA